MLVLAGTMGYMAIERWNFLDALFMTVTTLTTVGYGEVHPLDRAGQIYTMVLILVGVGFLIYILSATAQLMVEANPTAYFIRRRMKEKIAKLKGHQIVCGFGRTGHEVARLFHQNRVPFVVIETDLARIKDAEEQGFMALQGDATEDETLLSAQVRTAKGVVCTLPDDAANTFITLSAKGLNERITAVCRAANPGSEAKMVRAGAHSVISPYIICGRRMATAVTHPLVLEFLDVAMHSPSYDLRLEQVRLDADSPLVGATLKSANIKQASGAMVLAVNQSGKLFTNPPPEYVFQSDDELIVLGADEELNKVRQLAQPNKKE
ncbi:MAG TPA: potassium channel protein [Candidatus Obscuribacterales bacterium]